MKKLIKDLISIMIIFLVMMGLFFLGFAIGSPQKNDYSSNYTHQPNITYKNMSIEQIMNVTEIMSQVNPFYLNLQEQIIFDNSNESLSNGRNGLNSGNGKILTIDYQSCFKNVKENKTGMNCRYHEPTIRKVICHELLHTYITEIDRELEELIVEDIDNTLFCFK